MTSNSEITSDSTRSGSARRPLRGGDGPFCLRVHDRSLTLPPERLESARLFAGLRALHADQRGAMLLESADRSGQDGRFSLLLPAPSLRLVANRGGAEVHALDSRGSRLLAGFGDARDARSCAGGMRLAVPVAVGVGDPGGSDRERLRSPSALDLVRRLARVAVDRSSPTVPVMVAGALAYDLVDHFERLPERAAGGRDNDIDGLLSLDAVRIDHETGQVDLVARTLLGTDLDEAEQDACARERLDRWVAELQRLATAPQPAVTPRSLASPGLELRPDTSQAEFEAGVERVLEHVRAGDVFQAVLSRAIDVDADVAPDRVYSALRLANPSPYMFFVELEEGELLGASPETCLRVTEDRLLLSPIAGTVPRGRGPSGGLDADADARLAIQLMLDPKEQAEHAMLVDLARNDVARVALPGTRTVSDPFGIERYSHVQHLVSRVTGRLDPQLDALDAYRAVANMGTLTGAPKLRAMEILRGLEPTPRGMYGGAVFYLTAEGAFDSCIVIRSLRHRDSIYTVRSGAGIVLDSDPQREFLETEHKAGAPLAALREALAQRENSR